MSYFRKRTFTFCREFWDKIVVIFRTIPFFINGSRFVEMLLSIFSRLEKDFFFVLHTQAPFSEDRSARLDACKELDFRNKRRGLRAEHGEKKSVLGW